MQNLTFRSSRIIYYGPHECENCGVMIAKMGREFGGNAFTYPEGPIYPNTEWHPHVCDPKRVDQHKAVKVASRPPAVAPDAPMPKFSRPTCKGSFALGSACGHCDRCDWERSRMEAAMQGRACSCGPNEACEACCRRDHHE